MSTAATGGAIAAAAAAEAKRKREEEEERMTTYGNSDLEGWEFKIVRSNMGKFRNYETVKRICDEEAASGWELVEKFDDSRLRFKRKTSHRAQDAHRPTDPYRTETGIASSTLGLFITGTLLAVIGIVLAVVFMLR